MKEIIILFLLAVWSVFALHSIKKRKGCCGNCKSCSHECNKKPSAV